MRRLARMLARALVVTAALAAAVQPGGPLVAWAEDLPDAPSDPAPASCRGACRGLGLKKVQAGKEHCGLISRETKDEALDAACRLAESNREELQAQAEEKARGKCADSLDQAACSCQTELRAWQNVYTHVFSQNCWTECGWAFLVDCDQRSGADDG